MNPVRVVITVPWGERLGGAENMLWTFLRHARPELVRSTVVFFQAGPFQQEIADKGIRTLVIPTGRLRQVDRMAHSVRQLAGLLKQESPDILLNWSPKSHLYGAPAALLAGIRRRVVWWQHGLPRGGWMDRAATLLPARAVGCSSIASEASQRAMWPRRETFVVHPGIEEPPVPSRSQVVLLKERLGIIPNRTVIGIVGRLQPWKGQHRLLHAISELTRSGRNVHGLLVGGTVYDRSPTYGPSLLRLAEKLQITDRVTFTGQVSEPGAYIQMMDVSVNASLDEPFGLVILEAMALGIPVVAFDSAGPAEIIESGFSGILVPKGEPLTGSLERLVADPELRRQIGMAGRQRFLDSFTAGQMTERLESRLISLAKI